MKKLLTLSNLRKLVFIMSVAVVSYMFYLKWDKPQEEYQVNPEGPWYADEEKKDNE